MTEEFRVIYNQCFGDIKIPKELRSLLEEVFNSLDAEPVNLGHIRDSFVSLFSFLCKPENRTNQNCTNVDWFFAINSHWNRSNKYPEQHRNLLDNIGCLHDTFYAPEIAKDFESTPEQLLAQAKELIT